MTWDVSTPQGSEAANNGDNRIRELKSDLQSALRAGEANGDVAIFPGSDTGDPKYEYRGRKGTEAAKPAAGENGLYSNTSRGTLERDNGVSWDIIATLIPIGMVAPYAGSAAPSGWLACDGSAVSRTTYADLFAAIGVAHGSGDGSSTFNLPDYRGRFLRGIDGSAGNDPDKTSRTAMASGGNTGNNVGSVQADATAVNGMGVTDPGHTHKEYRSNTGGSDPGIGATAGLNGDSTGIETALSTKSATTGISLTGDNETRPANAYVLFIVKY